jgi:hypothetical protein
VTIAFSFFAAAAALAAAVIGGDCKASYLRKLAREGKIPSLWLGKYAFTEAHIRQIIAYCERPAKPAKAPAPQAASKRAAARPFPADAAGVTRLRAREPRKRTA